MKLMQCVNGHYYDGEQYTQCPHCSYLPPISVIPFSADSSQFGTTSYPDESWRSKKSGSPANPNPDFDYPTIMKTRSPEPDMMAADIPATMPKIIMSDNSDATMIEQGYSRPASESFSVGWLVCYSGTETGREFRLHSGSNVISGKQKADVLLDKDELVAPYIHAIIEYDNATRLFTIKPVDAKRPTIYNGTQITEETPLSSYDWLCFGQTCFVFIALCGERFGW